LETTFLDPDGVLKKAGPLPTLREFRTPGALTNYVQATRRSNEQAGPALNELIGKVSAFETLSAVDWVIDTRQLTSGHPAEALKKSASTYRMTDFGSLPSHVAVTPPDKYLLNYRNYLRTIFTGSPSSSDYTQYRNQLANRFHQDFIATDTSPKNAHWILATILTKALTAPALNYGFGLAANLIQPQGQKTNREYLDYLVGLTNLLSNEIALRYRLNLDRQEGEESNFVSENIFTLQHFYSDGFQSQTDPFPVIPLAVLGKAPFYLEYEEWYRLNGPFYGENYYQIRQTYFFDYDSDRRKTIKGYEAADGSDFLDGARWMAQLLEIDETISQAHGKLDLGLYTQATELYLQALTMAEAALRLSFKPVDSGTISYRLVLEKGKAFFPQDLVAALAERFSELHSLSVWHPSDLDWSSNTAKNFINFYRIYYYHYGSIYGPDFDVRDFLHFIADDHDRHELILLHLYLYVIPTCLGDTAMAAGDYVSAEACYALTTGFVVGKGELSMSTGYRQIDSFGIDYPQNVHDAIGALAPYPVLLQNGALPYSADVSERPGYNFPSPPTIDIALGQLVVPSKTHPMERKFFCLRHGAALLEWADALYRTADDSSIRRARELYKSVVFLHGWNPGVAPHWSQGLDFGIPYFFPGTMNPAILSQLGRSDRMLFQINHGMNYYGYTDEAVPALRYRPLKDAADRFAAAAKAAQSDYFEAFSKVEEAVKEGLVTANLLKKAQLQSSMADEQKGIADFDVLVAQGQLDQVNAAIKKKQDEIDDHDGLGQQFVDWFGGFVHTLTSLPSGLTSGLGGGVAAGVGLSETSASGGLFGGGGWLGLGAGASVAGAYGIFIYAAISSELSVFDADQKRSADLKTLQNQSLPLAEAQLAAKQNEVYIATLQGQIAQTDAELALALFHFQETRTLTTEFWASIAAVLRRVLRRYLELAAKFAWLAERALAYGAGSRYRHRPV
jgi:hypothetical protein